MNGLSIRLLLRVQSIALMLVIIYVGLLPPDPCRSACAVAWPPFARPDPTHIIIGAILAILAIVGLIRSVRARAG